MRATARAALTLAALATAACRASGGAGLIEEPVPVFRGHQDLHVSGPPIARYRSAGTEAWDVEAGFPVHGVPVAEGRVEAAKLPGGRMAKTLHVGAYADVGQAYAAVQDWLVGHGYAAEGDPWECYLDGPEVPRPRTEIFFPCHQVKPVRARAVDLS